MTFHKYFARSTMSGLLALTFLSLAPVCQANNPVTPGTITNEANPIAADNSGQNKGQNSITAEQQSNSPRDIYITKTIRQSVEQNGALSGLAKNVKIITVNGSVTLRGPVKTMDEKNSIAQIARKVAGGSNVHNQLAVKTKQ